MIPREILMTCVLCVNAQLSQAYEFISNHEFQMDSDDFPSYAKVICDVFVGNSRYLE